ncbi:Rieske (2Fe-2S) protein [Bradyrhizobium sp. WSM471]|uniref:Rieske (2Fe-2S) protein n=1 Tax=Bradyrhizobium sp. WSM471 TaxID=319017 RepID=UPI0031339EDF
MSSHIVATVDEIAHGTCKIVLVRGREIGVFRIHDEFFALIKRCPHQGAELCKGDACQ